MNQLSETVFCIQYSFVFYVNIRNVFCNHTVQTISLPCHCDRDAFKLLRDTREHTQAREEAVIGFTIVLSP